MQKIFVYGTLLKGCRNYRKYLEDHVGQIQSAYVRGTLYSIKNKDYPALLEGNDFIAGEIMEIDDSLCDVLDRLEGFRCNGDLMNEYNKKTVWIYDLDFQPIIQLPVYFYNIQHPEQIHSLHEEIKSGSYRTWLNEHVFCLNKKER